MVRAGLCALCLSLLASGCLFGGSDVGNVEKTCKAGEACVCDVLGNCDLHCPAGGCGFDCRGTSNCDMDCSENCTASCSGTGNCSLHCTGGGCSFSSCVRLGNCVCTSDNGSC